jgi:predicted dehydrogenase
VAPHQLSIIQVGVGFWGRGWAEIVSRARGFRLAAVVDAAAPARDWAAAEIGVPTFGTLGAALDETAADAALLVSPPETHRVLAEAALDRGLHVVSEKPLALDLDDARAMADAAARSGLQLIVAQNYRFRRQPKALQRLISNGSLGRLLGIRISCRRDLRASFVARGDWRSLMAHPYVVDMAIHHVDLLRMISGLEIARVDARAWCVPDSPFSSEPNVDALLTLADGTPVAYDGTFAAVGRETSWNGDWEVVGTDARATWTGGVNNPLRGTVAVERYGSPPVRASLPALPALDRLGVLHELRRAALEGAAPEAGAADNVHSVAAILAIGRSIEERGPVAL